MPARVPRSAAVVHLAAPRARRCAAICERAGAGAWDRLCRSCAIWSMPSAAPDDLLGPAYAKAPSPAADRACEWRRLWAMGPDRMLGYFALADAIVAGRPRLPSRANAGLRLLDDRRRRRGILAALDHPPAMHGSPIGCSTSPASPPVELEWLVTVLEDASGGTVERRRADWAARGRACVHARSRRDRGRPGLAADHRYRGRAGALRRAGTAELRCPSRDGHSPGC